MRVVSLIVCFVTFFPLSAVSSPQDEIAYLLGVVAATSCKYERNGSVHSGEEAVKHINKKYKYYRKKIKTAEDFILHSATKSKMSGKYYNVLCGDGVSIKSKDWLLAELKRFRSLNGGK